MDKENEDTIINIIDRNIKKIAKLRQHAIDYARAHKEADSREWRKVNV